MTRPPIASRFRGLRPPGRLAPAARDPGPFALAAWDRARRASAWAALGQPGRPPRERAWPWVAAAALLTIALAGPRWGDGDAPPPGHDVVLLVDVSRSMAAEDAIPDRLGSAKAAALGLIAALGRDPGDRVGVIAFAGRARPACPLTQNLGAAADAVRALEPGSVEPGGTDLGDGLAAALDGFDDQEPRDGRQVVVFTDGEDHAGSWPLLVDRIKALRVIVHGVTIGDAEGGQPVPAGPGGSPMTYRGEPVRSRRSDAALEAICRASGGALVPMGRSRADLGALYRDRIAPAARRTLATTRPPDRIDRYAPFLAAALGLLVVTSWPNPRRLAALGLVLMLGVGAAPQARTAAEAVALGNAAYAAKDYATALARFEEAASLDPRAAVARYNVAATLYQLGRFDDAAAQYLRARDDADPHLRARIDYALGNAAVARGQAREALEHYDLCLASKAGGADIAALKRDAATNRRYAATLLPPPPSPDPDGDRRTRGPSPRPSDGNDGPPPDDAKGDPPPGTTGSAPAPPSATGDERSRPDEAPDRRLDAMLSAVRKAQDGRPADRPPPAGASGDVKDW